MGKWGLASHATMAMPEHKFHQPQLRPDSPAVSVRHSRDERKASIVDGFLRRSAEVHRVRPKGLSLGKGASPDAETLSVAMRTSLNRFSTWPGPALQRRFLAAKSRWFDKYLSTRAGCPVVIWNGTRGYRLLLAEGAKARGHEVIYFDEAPIPRRIQIDRFGINFGSSLPSELGFYLRWADRYADERAGGLEDWRRIKADLVARAGPNSEQKRDEIAEGERFVFCPLQVPYDSQISVYGDWVRSIEELIEALHSACASLPPNWHLRVKEHPSSRTSFGRELRALESESFRVDNTTDTFLQVGSSRGVLTVNSSVGLQAFFFDKPVLVLGSANYAIRGIAEKISSARHLADALSNIRSLTFDAKARNVFMTYLVNEHFPLESDVRTGKWGMAELLARDSQRDRILREVDFDAG